MIIVLILFFSTLIVSLLFGAVINLGVWYYIFAIAIFIGLAVVGTVFLDFVN